MLAIQVVSLEGVSLLVIALHLSDQLGDFAGTHASIDADWNIHLIGNLDYINSVRFADFSLCRISAVILSCRSNSNSSILSSTKCIL